MSNQNQSFTELYEAAFEFQQATQERLNAQFAGTDYWIATDDWRRAEKRLVLALAEAGKVVA